MEALARAKIRFTGAGGNLSEARKPAIFKVEGKGRVILFALCADSSGVPAAWAAAENRPGVNLIRNLSGETIQGLAEDFRQVKQAGDILVVSIHWGGNWGYEVPRGKLILYGCGDFINDYEGIGGYKEFRDDLVLMYFPSVDAATGKLINLQMMPLEIKRFRLRRAARTDAGWLRDTLNRQSRAFGCQVVLGEDNRLYLRW